jgi:hypothetical protein
MFKYLLAFAVAVPASSYCQSYADSPFYQTAAAVPSTAHVEGWSHGSTNASGIVIDLSERVNSSSSDFDDIRGWSVHSWVDRRKPDHTFHYYLQYDQLNVIFGYDLRVEPVKGTDEIRCTFSALTDPEELPSSGWSRSKDTPVVALQGDLSPFVIKSGSVISITTLPLGKGRIPVIHYLRLTRIDLTSESMQLR